MRVRVLGALLVALGMTAVAGGVGARQAAPARAGVTAASLDTGKKLFMQRCSICHLPPLGPGEQQSYAGSLAGYVKGPDTEATARLIIEQGVPPRMPGFRYGLAPEEIDSIVAYVGTLR